MAELNPIQNEGLKLMQKGYNVFLTGQAGTGKSHLLKVFTTWLKQNNKRYGVTSTTGVSALLIGGTTLHSWAGILLGMEDKITLLERVMSRDKPYRRWLYTKVLIIDEISMMSPDLFEKLDYIGKKIRKSTKPFGGIQLVLVGDMLQLPPVKSDYVFTSPLWDASIDRVVYLTQNMRQADPTFQSILSEVRIGELSPESISLLRGRIGKTIDTPEGIEPTKLYSHRATVAKINHTSLMSLVTPENSLVRFVSKDDVKRKDGKLIPSRYREDYLGRIDKIFQAVKTLELCVGAQVMLIFNMDVPGGLANGSRGVVIGFENNLPVVRFMNGVETPVSRTSWSMKVAEGTKVSRNQIPLILAWACTIHKAQGSTLDCAQIDLGATLFEYGQGYTALSRCRSLDKLSIVTMDVTRLVASPKVLKYYSSINNRELKELEKKNEMSDGDCLICCERDKNCVFIPCGHTGCCIQCGYNLETCPICRSDISSVNKVYM